jgi:predicted nucleotidyltransferase
MSSIPESLNKSIQKFQDDVQSLFGSEIVSILVYGSAVTEDYVPRKSDVNVLVVLSESGISDLQPVQKIIRKWRRRGLAAPLFLTESYISASLDSFPIEFLNMQAAYSVILGKDVLAGLSIAPKDLRLQCERELKGKLLQLRQGFIQTEGNKQLSRSLIAESIGTFVAIFRALLKLKGENVPSAKREVIEQTCQEFGLDESLFSTLSAIRTGTVKLSRDELGKKLKEYIDAIHTLSQHVDGM